MDSLEDLKNHTYNELFVSGGFIVPDDTVLNPDSVMAGKISLLIGSFDMGFFTIVTFS